MNEEKLSIPHLNSLEGQKEDSEEIYEVIEEDYRSSPKCGIKSRIVKKVMRNIIFSPIEISTNPYIKYCVTQLKEEEKNHNSSNLTTNSNTNNLKLTKKEIKNKKDEIRMSLGNEDNKERKETIENNNFPLVEEKKIKIAKNMANKYNGINKKKEKNINLIGCNNFINSEKETKKIISIKLKLNLNNEREQNKINPNSQKNIFNILNNIENPKMTHSLKVNSNKLIHEVDKNDKDSNKAKPIYNLHSLSLKDEKVEERRFTPKNMSISEMKDNNYKFTMPSLFTTNNIKRIKKPKKFQDNEINIPKRVVERQHSFIPLSKNKKVKIHVEEKDKDSKKKRKHSLIPQDKNNKGNKLYSNILDHNFNKKNSKKNNSKHQKMKSLGEKKYELIKFEKENCYTPTKKMICSIKLKMDNSFKESEHNKNSDLPITSKAKRRVSIFDNNNIDNTKKKKTYTEEKKETSLFKNKKSNFICLKDKEKDKKKVKIKKKKKIKQKENKGDKDKKNKKDSNPNRKDKSFTIISKMKKNLINDEDNSYNNNNNDSLHSSKSSLNIIDINRKNSQKSKSKASPKKSNETKQDLTIPDVRRNSTRGLNRENKEKILAYTNKQTIENINEYTRQCLEIIPDLFDLGEKMPRCKTRVNLNFKENKKIALFDLDETIVHCIGEINMNNIESLSRQSDAKIKVHLPGGKREVTIGINIRPHWEEALSKIKNKYHIVAFTASHESYADSVLNYIDPNKKYFEYRLYRAHCVLCVMNEMKFYIKDLKILEDSYDLKDVAIIDNSVLSFAYHLDNGIPISPFYDSKTDTELLDIADFLVKYADENDIRSKLKEVYKLNQYLEILKNYNSDESSNISIIEEENKDENKNIPSLSRNKTNVDLEKSLINKTINKDNDKNNENIKNISQINLKLKDINNMFNDNNNKDDKENSKNKAPNINEPKNIKKIISKFPAEKNGKYLKKEKQRTQKLDINFIKEWEKKQKELKNRNDKH